MQCKIKTINMNKENEELTLLKKELEHYIKTAKKFNFPRKVMQEQIDLYLDDINQILKKQKKER